MISWVCTLGSSREVGLLDAGGEWPADLNGSRWRRASAIRPASSRPVVGGGPRVRWRAASPRRRGARAEGSG